jgi:glutathione synthase/RimK-type ligase-like ATP-grasp enzyme
MDVAILGAGQGWHFAEMERALRARGHRAHDLRVSALVAHIGDPPRLEAGGVALQDVGAVLTRIFPKGSLEQVIFRVDALHWLERLGIPVMNPATAIERTVDKFYTSALLAAAGLPASSARWIWSAPSTTCRRWCLTEAATSGPSWSETGS